jgi:hypothetical protein
MDIVRELTVKLASGTDFVIGTDLFAHYLPPEVADTAVGIMDGPGVPPGVYPIGDIGNFDVQVVSRSMDREVARSRCWTVHNALHGLAGEDLGDWFAHYVSAVQTPYPLGPDSRGRMEYVVHFSVQASQ